MNIGQRFLRGTWRIYNWEVLRGLLTGILRGFPIIKGGTETS